MAQFLRVCKPEICCVARSYGTQRYQQNHYEILNVSPNASQKDIRQAFLRLSKQLHPDASGKQDHADFARLNEAYSILGKESTKRQYDFDLKYCRYKPSYTNNSQKTHYSSQWEYEVRMAGGPWPPPPQNPHALPNRGLLVVLVCFGLGLLQMIFMFYSMNVRRTVSLRHARIEYEYQQIRNSARIKTSQIVMKDINSAEDLKEYLTKNSSDC